MPREFDLQLVNSNLYLERLIPVFLVDRKVGFGYEGDFLVRSLRTENVAQRNILEPLGLADIVVVWLHQVSFVIKRGLS